MRRSSVSAFESVMAKRYRSMDPRGKDRWNCEPNHGRPKYPRWMCRLFNGAPFIAEAVWIMLTGVNLS
jgi:hypothetical protein